MGADYARYCYFVAPIVLLSRGNGSPSRPVEPGLCSRGSAVEWERRGRLLGGSRYAHRNKERGNSNK